MNGSVRTKFLIEKRFGRGRLTGSQVRCSLLLGKSTHTQAGLTGTTLGVVPGGGVDISRCEVDLVLLLLTPSVEEVRREQSVFLYGCAIQQVLEVLVSHKLVPFCFLFS